MQLKINEQSNYLAKLIRIDNLRKHSNADRLQVTTIDGNNVITDLTAKLGDLYVFFPIESALNKKYISWMNGFENSELNQNSKQKGFFNKHGRVRAIRLRGEKSEGYITSAASLEKWISEVKNQNFSFSENQINTEFDTIESERICEKYVNSEYLAKLQRKQNSQKNQNKKVKISKLIEGQFHLHIDTAPLRKYVHQIQPKDLIQITKKLHGTSFVVSRVLCKRKLSWIERILLKLGVTIQTSKYDLVYSSRKVVKNDDLQKNQNHYYDYDLWGDISKRLEFALCDGITLYGEAVGYTKTGSYIQKNYDYGCPIGKFETYIYRITYTNATGKVFEFSSQQVRDYCAKYDLKVVPELYYGRAEDLFELDVSEHWHENFASQLSETYLEKNCDMCINTVPDEGIVLRREVFDIDVYKLKSFRFLEMETAQLDSGEVDLETLNSMNLEDTSETVPSES